jgi:hypothetical protein
MPKHPLSVPSPSLPRPWATDPLWPPLPIAPRRQCHALRTALRLHVLHSQSSQEKSDEQPDASRASATCGHVYVRQSTGHPVCDPHASQRRQ